MVKWIYSLHSSITQQLSSTWLESEIDRGLLERCITVPVSAHDISRAAVLYLALKRTVTQVFQANWENYWQVGSNTKEAINLIKSLCNRFHFVVQRFQPQNFSIETTDECNIQDLLQVLSQLHSDKNALEAKIFEAVHQKRTTQTINQIMITGGNFNMSSNQNNSVEVQQNFNASVYGVAGKVEGDQNIFMSEQKQTLTEAAQEIQQLLKQLEVSNPTATEIEKSEFVTTAIAPNRRQRFLSALNAGGEEIIKELLDNSYVNVAIAILEGWKNAGK